MSSKKKLQNSLSEERPIVYAVAGAAFAALGYFFIVFSKTLGMQLMILEDTNAVDIFGGFLTIAGVVVILLQIPALLKQILNYPEKKKKELEHTVDKEVRNLER